MQTQASVCQKKFCKSQDFAFCSDAKIRLRRIGGCHARSPFFLSSTALALNRTFIASCTVDTTDKSQSSRHIPLDFTWNASCNPPEMQANALGRTARRSVPAAFVGCVTVTSPTRSEKRSRSNCDPAKEDRFHFLFLFQPLEREDVALSIRNEVISRGAFLKTLESCIGHHDKP